MLKNILVISADIGHSGAKVQWTTSNSSTIRNRKLIPTNVINWFELKNEETARRAEAQTVELDGKSYFFGETARTQRVLEDYSGRESNWITEGVAHDVMLAGSIKTVMREYAAKNLPSPDEVIVLLGLPTDYYASQRDILKERANKIIKSMLIQDTPLIVGIKAQSEAPIYNISYDNSGKAVNLNYDEISYGVVEVGHFTVDFSLFINASMVTEQGGSIPQGVHTVYTKMRDDFLTKGYPTEIGVIEKAVQTGKIKFRGEEIDVSKIVSECSQEIAAITAEKMRILFGDRLNLLDKIIVAGGGATLVGPYLARTYTNIHIPEESRWAVSEGLLRVALYNAHKRAKQ